MLSLRILRGLVCLDFVLLSLFILHLLLLYYLYDLIKDSVYGC